MNLNGEKLRAARDAKKISRAQLSRTIGVTIETIERAEKNKNVPNANTIAAIAAALDVPMESLFDTAETAA